MKKLVSLLMSGVMLTACGAMLSACGGENDDSNAKYKYDITVWVGEETKTLTENLISKFNRENTQSIKFNANIQEVTEGRAAGDITAKPAEAPEIFCFAQDQIARLVDAKLLATPTKSITDSIKANHSASSVKAATVGSTVYAYPLTEDNGYFLYYDTRVISAEQATSIEAIVSACESQNKYFSFNLTGEGAGWYVSSFFYAVGAKSEWATNDLGKFTGYEDTFNSPEGLKALKGIQKVVKSDRYIKNGKASDFNAATPAGAVVSGVWDYQTAKNALGDNLGITKLPKFTVDGTEYQLASFLGSKLMGVTPQQDPNKAAALAILAQYLTNKDSQMERFNALGWGPSEKAAQTDSKVTSNAALSALKASATVLQGQYPADWWAKPQTLALRAQDAASDLALQTALESYASELAGLGS